MTLDDLIKANKKPSARGSGSGRGGRSSASGPARRLPNRSTNRAIPYATPKAPESAWRHDMFSGGGGASGIGTGTKLYISNLDYGVSNGDVKELFAEVGDLKRYMIHYDRSGRSKGTAEVAFSRRQDALAAVKKYNNVQLDGKPMKVDLVGTNISAPADFLPLANANGDSSLASRGAQGGGGFGRSHGGRRVRGFGRGRGLVKGHGEKISSEDLDADLEKYHADAMQTN